MPLDTNPQPDQHAPSPSWVECFDEDGNPIGWADPNAMRPLPFDSSNAPH